jgi:hypothetical protein
MSKPSRVYVEYGPGDFLVVAKSRRERYVEGRITYSKFCNSGRQIAEGKLSRDKEIWYHNEPRDTSSGKAPDYILDKAVGII